MTEIKCKAFLPPTFSQLCLKPTECNNFCFSHCSYKNYPNGHVLRCPNPKHPFISWPPKPKPKPLHPWYTNNSDISNLSKAKLKSRLIKDLDLLEELKGEIEASFTPHPNDPDTWDPDACGELQEALDKLKFLLESPNGLQDKLESWNYFQEEVEDEYD